VKAAVPFVLLLLAGAFAGCIGSEAKEKDSKAPIVPVSKQEQLEVIKKELRYLGDGNRTDERIRQATSELPYNYSFPGQLELPEVGPVYFNGTIAPADGPSHEAPRDEGAIQVRPIYKTAVVTEYLPPGQPVEVSVVLGWVNDLGSSADLDIYADLPGRKSEFSLQDQYFKMGANYEVATYNVVGVEGRKSFIGVQASNPNTLLREVSFTVRIVFTYAQDVVGPHVAYALDVPDGGRTLVFSTEKARGEDHLKAGVMLVGPDNAVQYLEYDDVALPDQQAGVSVYPGRWTLYSDRMQGGFLRVRADVPLPASKAVPVATEVVTTTVATTPDAPSAASWVSVGWESDQGRVPLGMWFTINKERTVVANVTGELSNGNGRVLLYRHLARVNLDDDEAVGLTDEESRRRQFQEYHPARVTAGSYTLRYSHAATSGLTLHALYVAAGA